MVFSSFEFLHVFLPITLILGISVHKFLGARFSNPLLFAASIFFYAYAVGGSFLLIFSISVLSNFLFGLWTDRLRSQGLSRNVPLWLSVVLNVGLLAYFKYANFFVGETNALRQALGFSPIIWDTIILPVGISFFTFQSMSYVFDVSAGRAKVLRNPIDYGLYVAMFPQLVAGPIVRFGLIAKQLRQREIAAEDLRAGAIRFAHGLVKKVVVADAAGRIADQIFDVSGSDVTSSLAWLAAIAYTVQIYFDFSGYSDMAIGLGRMLGFRYPENFDRPYRSLSITEFWRRWHLTLSHWFRDYVYIPLGGSKRGSLNTYTNLWVVFVLTGIWHGANWTFLIWGIFHGGLLVIERVTDQRKSSAQAETMMFTERLARRCGVLLLVVFGWVLFRSESLAQATEFLGSMLFEMDWTIPPETLIQLRTSDLILLVAGVTLTVFVPTHIRGPELYVGRFRLLASASLLLIAFPWALIQIMAGSYSPFLYFQF